MPESRARSVGPASSCGALRVRMDSTAVGSMGGHRHPWASIPMWGLYSVYWQHCCGVNGWPPTPMGQHPYVGFILCVLTTLLWGQWVATDTHGPASLCGVYTLCIDNTAVGSTGGHQQSRTSIPMCVLGVCIDVMGQYPCRGPGVCIGTMDHACWGPWGMHWHHGSVPL